MANMTDTPTPDCPLCTPGTEAIVWEDECCRVIRVDAAGYGGYCRVIWTAHVAEMTDLTPSAQRHLMNVVLATETALRTLMRPAKVNLASLGNMVPHLHWHVIPRFRDDRHFPESIWGPAQRDGVEHASPQRQSLHGAIVAALTELTAG